MFFNKLNAFFLVVWLMLQASCVGATTATQDDKHGDMSPRLKQNALNLLTEVSRETGQFRQPENRVRARTIIADLMWEHDEAAARLVNKYAYNELRNLLREIDSANAKKMSGEEETELSVSRFRLTDLRREYVLMLAARDPALAVDALRALKTKKLEIWEPLAERELDLKLEAAAVISAKDAGLAHGLYKEELAAGGISVKLIESLNDLHRKNPELTAKVAKDIFAVIKNAKIGEKSTAAQSNQELEFWQAGIFLSAAAALNRRARREKNMPALSETEMRELAELIARAFLATPAPAKNTINKAMTAITLYAPEQARQIRQKVGAEGVRGIETVMKSDAYYLSLEEKDADGLAREAADADDPFHRDLLYSEAARKALAAGEPEKAQRIAARIKNRESYGMLIEDIEIAVPLAVARRGDSATVRQMIADLKTNEQRIDVLLELASALAAKGEKDAAKKLLDEVSQMMVTAAPLKSETDGETPLETRMELAAKFVTVGLVVAPDESFKSIEAIIEFANAEIKRNMNSEAGVVAARELFYEVMERKLLLHTPQTIDLLKNLAQSDFARTVKLIDRFEETEIRLFARLRLAQSLLDPAAAEKEKAMRQRFLDELYET